MMCYSHKYLLIAVLLAFICQTTAKNECEKDPIKTGQELLDTAPTLFNGIKSGSFDGEMAIKWLQKYAFGVLCCQKIEPKFEMNENFKKENPVFKYHRLDPIKTGQELLNSAPTLFNGIKSGSFDGEMAIKWLQKYAFGVLCCQKIEPKFEMNENFKNLQNNFCQQLKNGKSMEEAAVNVESAAIKVMQNLDKENILQNIRQKIAGNSFLDEKNKEKMAKLLGQFQIGLNKFYGVIKARLNVAHSRDEADHSNGGNALRQHQKENALRQHQRRRRKRMRTLEAVTGRFSLAFSTENPRTAQPPVKRCVVIFVTAVCTIGAAIFLAITGMGHAAMKIALFFFLVGTFLVLFPVFIWKCVVEKLRS